MSKIHTNSVPLIDRSIKHVIKSTSFYVDGNILTYCTCLYRELELALANYDTHLCCYLVQSNNDVTAKHIHSLSTVDIRFRYPINRARITTGNTNRYDDLFASLVALQ